MAPVIVTRATARHAEDAQRLLEEYYRDVTVLQRDTPQQIRCFLENRDSGLWLAYQGAEPAGCVVLRPLPQIADAAECKRLYVRAAFRRRGIADALLDALEDYARCCAVAWVYLDSKDDLVAAIALYRRRGYAACARYNDNVQATVFLRKALCV